MPQRKLDVVLDSVKRLQRMGATANLVNLLQKQHPADLAQLFAELPRQGSPVRLLAAGRAQQPPRDGGAERARARSRRRAARRAAPPRRSSSSRRICRPTTPRRSSTTCPRSWRRAVLELMQKRPAGADVGELLEYPEQTAGRIMNPKVFALSEDMTGGGSHHRAPGVARRRDGLLSLRHRRAPPPRRRRLAAPPAARASRHAAQADHDDRPDQRARRHRSGRGRAAGRVVQPAGHPGRRRGEQAGRRHHRRRRHRRHQGRGDRGRLSAGRPGERRPRVHVAVRVAAQAAAVADRQPRRPRSSRRRSSSSSRTRSASSRRSRCSCRSSPAWAATRRRRR